MDEKTITHLNKIISSRVTSGVVIIDATGEILYINDEAHAIFATFSLKDVSSGKDPLVPDKAVVDSINKHLGHLSAYESTCILCPETGTTYALRTLPLHKPGKKGKQCIMVLIEGVTIHRKFDIKAVQKQFGLSKRETEVTFCLTKGLTNKEIAKTLALSPDTVHDYIKQIMKKLKTATRAGIVGKVLP
ncbi:MAG: hypothetical protein C4581_01325 [Nitrospiraceae bacterium]|nr:MAG: hypothetical protein C4581_01325 [Nitrospiraceae bacterium]